jgi:hypothetical protein
MSFFFFRLIWLKLLSKGEVERQIIKIEHAEKMSGILENIF